MERPRIGKVVLRWWLLAAAISLGAGCALNPVTGRPEVTLISTSKEIEITQEEAKKVEASMGLLEAPALGDYVATIGRKVAQHSPRQDVKYNFFVVDAVEPNAFALPGGYIYVTRGLLALVNSEDELANVIGHEVGHVAARHSTRRATVGAPLAILTGITATATGLVSPALGNLVAGVGGLGNELIVAPYSREQENDADRIGMKLAATAGYDSMAMSSFLHSLQREEELHGGGAERFSFLASHPAVAERVVDTAAYSNELPKHPSPVAGERHAFLRHLDGLVIGANPDAGVLEDNRFLHPALGVLLQFPAKWQARNIPVAVSALSPEKDALIALEGDGKGNDPLPAARKMASELKIDEGRLERSTINGLPAVSLHTKAASEGGRVAADITWVALQGNVYRLTAMADERHYEKYRSTFAATARSIRTATAAEKDAVRVNRLRLVEARQGETPAQLHERSKTVWKLEELAVANGLEPTQKLDAGQTIKIARREPYNPGR